jgi:hypothetical protein
VGTMWVGGQARGSGAGRCHGHVDGVVLGELHSTATVWSPSWWHTSPCFGAGEDMPRGNSRPRFSKVTAAVSTDVVPFLKTLLRLLPTLIHAQGETQDPRIGRWQRPISCSALLEDVVLKSRRAARQ